MWFQESPAIQSPIQYRLFFLWVLPFRLHRRYSSTSTGIYRFLTTVVYGKPVHSFNWYRTFGDILLATFVVAYLCNVTTPLPMLERSRNIQRLGRYLFFFCRICASSGFWSQCRRLKTEVYSRDTVYRLPYYFMARCPVAQLPLQA